MAVGMSLQTFPFWIKSYNGKGGCSLLLLLCRAFNRAAPHRRRALSLSALIRA